MHAKIGPVDLQIEHTSDVHLRRAKDQQTGLDTLWYELSLSMVCIWSPYATATTTAIVAGATGDALGVTLANLKDTLLQRGQQITLTIGPDRVIQAPRNDPDGDPLPCDPAGGPTVHDVQIREVLADKTAIVMVRLTLAYNSDNHAVVSHRWRVRSFTDGRTRLSRRVVEGWAVLRMDWLNSFNPPTVPDQLRAAFIMSEPQGFIRHAVHCDATPDGQKLHYTVEDRQQWRNLGPKSAAVRVKGDATAAVEWPFHEIKGVLKAMGDALGGGWDLLEGNVGKAVGAWAGLIPTAKARVLCRVKGHAQAELADLVNTGIICCLDRFAPLTITDHTLWPMSVVVSDGLDNEEAPQVQVKMEFLAVNRNVFQALMKPQTLPRQMMNLDGDVAKPNGIAFMSRDPFFGNPRLPASNGSRGHWISMLVTQILGTPAVPVAPIPADGVPVRPEFLALP